MTVALEAGLGYQYRVVLRVLRVIAVLATAACTRQAVSLDGRHCDSGDCSDGFVCNPLTQTCSSPVISACDRPDAVCPSTTATSDPCTFVGSFLPCVEGTAGCEEGCRLCLADHTWGGCSCAGHVGQNCTCYPSNGGVERCDGFDNDCNGVVDDGGAIEGCINSWVDADHDGWGAGDATCACGVPPGRSRINGDPDDTNPNISPDAGEICDGIDNNLDGASLAREIDDDLDGYVECDNWVGSNPNVVAGGDCDDADDQTHPNAPAELCDGVANKCTPSIPANELDSDGDGYVGCSGWQDRHLLYPSVIGGGDCGPGNSKSYPGAPEIWDSQDNDCDGKTDECLANCDCGPLLVSCYPLDTEPTASDLGPANVDASVQSGNASLIAGVIGNAYSVDASYYLEGATSSAQDLAHFTISVMVKPDALLSGTTVATIVDVQSEYGIQLLKNGNTVCFYANGSTSYSTLTVNAALGAGAWQHVGCTYDGSDLRMYVDGYLVGSKSSTSSVRTTKTGTLRIGSNSPTSGDTGLNSFTGGLDHLKIFSEALSDVDMCAEGHRLVCP